MLFLYFLNLHVNPIIMQKIDHLLIFNQNRTYIIMLVLNIYFIKRN